MECKMCTAFMARTEELLLEHVSKVHAHSADFQMPCIMRGCQRTYHNYGALRRHLRQTHNFYTRKTNSATVPSLGDEENPITSIDDYSDLPDREVGPPTKKKRAEWILKIKETNKLTQTCTENILQDVTHLCTSIILDLTSVVKQQLDMHNATPELSHDMMSALQSDTYNQPFKGLETHYKQMQYLRESFNFVDPIQIKLGSDQICKTVRGQQKLVDVTDSFTYIPLLPLLQAMIKNDKIYQEICDGHRRSDGVVEDYIDSNSSKSHPLFGEDFNAIQLLLYYDEVELCNALGSSRKKHKLGCFYFTLGNLKPCVRSSLKAIQILALAEIPKISKYGIAKILQPIVEDIATLEQGVTFITYKGETKLRGSLVSLSADNLGSHFIGGFKGSCTASRPCRHCTVEYADMKNQMMESSSSLRSADNYDTVCDLLEEGTDTAPSLSKTYGINNRSLLNKLEYFHVCNFGLPPDVMHDLLEGYIPYTMKLLLNQIINKEKLFTLDYLNNVILYFNYGTNDARNKPNCLTAKELVSESHGLNQSASQMWTLSRLLPMMVGKKVPYENAYWLHFIEVLEIMDYTLRPIVRQSTPDNLAAVIASNLYDFQLLYPTSPFIPKMHYMTHIPRYLKNVGPLVRHWTIRYEAKHQYLKALSTSIGNFINITHTLAVRHQSYQCYHLCADDPYELKLEVGPGKTIEASESEYAPALAVYNITSPTSPSLYQANWITVSTYQLKPGIAIILSASEETAPSFGIVKQILCDGQIILLCVNQCINIAYRSHLRAWEVKQSPEVSVVKFNKQITQQILQPIPANFDTYYISLKYAL